MHPFLEACGATGPLQLSIECQGVPGAETVEFDQPYVVVGRDPKSDLHFPHPDVSERHVYLQIVGGHLCYVDLGSRSGTYLEGRCLRSGWLPLHKTLRVGPYRLRLVDGIAEEPAPEPRPSTGTPGFGLPPLPDGAPAPVTLELSHRGLRASTCPVHGELLLVGSSADCDVRVLDPSVSNYHASLLHTPSGLWVVDLLGLRGVCVNGEPTRAARLDDGNELRVGQSLIKIRRSERVLAVDNTRDPDSQGAGEPTPSDCLPVAAPEPAARPALAESLSAEVVDAFLSPLVDQFRLMQRELFDELRKALSDELSRAGAELILELSAAQQEHARSLKRELEHFQRLNRELEVLKAELAARGASPNGQAAPEPAPRPTRLGTAVAAPVSRPFVANGTGESNGHPAADGSGLPTDPPVTPEEAQSWLYQRIALIQDEQQGRWQKLLETIPNQLLGRLPV